MAITIRFLADIADWIRGVGQAKGGAEEMEQSLEDLLRKGIELGRELGLTTDQIAADFAEAYGLPLDRAKRAVEEVAAAADALKQDTGRATGDVADGFEDVEDAARRAGDEIEDSSRRGGEKTADLKGATDKVKGGLTELGGIARDVLAGDFASAAEQGLSAIGGLLGIAGLGGIAGVAAAAAGEAGIGLLVDSFEKVTEATNKARDSAYEYGMTVAASSEYANAASRLNELTSSTEKLKEIQDLAIASGWEQKDVLAALATGDGLPALTKAFEDNALSTNISMGRLGELNGVLYGTRDGFDLSREGAKLNESAMYDLATRTGIATGKFDELGRQIYRMPDGKEVVVDAKTGTAKERLDEVKEKTENLPDGSVKISVDDSDVQNWSPPSKRGVVIYEAQGNRRQIG